MGERRRGGRRRPFVRQRIELEDLYLDIVAEFKIFPNDDRLASLSVNDLVVMREAIRKKRTDQMVELRDLLVTLLGLEFSRKQFQFGSGGAMSRDSVFLPLSMGVNPELHDRLKKFFDSPQSISSEPPKQESKKGKKKGENETVDFATPTRLVRDGSPVTDNGSIMMGSAFGGFAPEKGERFHTIDERYTKEEFKQFLRNPATLKKLPYLEMMLEKTGYRETEILGAEDLAKFLTDD